MLSSEPDVIRTVTLASADLSVRRTESESDHGADNQSGASLLVSAVRVFARM